MANSVGIIFHNKWKFISPLLYSGYGADVIPSMLLPAFAREYRFLHLLDLDEGDIYNCDYIMARFILYVQRIAAVRITNISDILRERTVRNHIYPNLFAGGCYIIDVSEEQFGHVDGDGRYKFIDNNIMNGVVKDE